MLPGPVFAVELLTTAHRARYYALRSLYGLALLLVFWISYSAFTQSMGFGRETFTPGELSLFARRTFIWFAVAQGVTVLVITPALVGGTIAGEKSARRCTTCSPASSPAARSCWASCWRGCS